MGKPILVTWDDAWHAPEYWTIEEIAAESGKRLTSVGICIRDDAKAIAIAADAIPNDPRFRDIKFIPRPYVVEVKELRI